jgi:dihydrofolate reductase
MSTNPQEEDQMRTVIAQANVTIDGITAGPDGDLSWLIEHAVTPQMSAYAEGIWRGASTAVMGRTNYEGYHGYWPSVASDPQAAPRDRALATWLDTVEKVVFSRTLEEAPWQNSRVARDVEAEMRALQQAPGEDILVLNSASIIQALLAVDLLDELRLNMLPSIVGGGLRLFPDGLPRSAWDLVGALTLDKGGVALHYRRRRES